MSNSSQTPSLSNDRRAAAARAPDDIPLPTPCSDDVTADVTRPSHETAAAEGAQEDPSCTRLKTSGNDGTRHQGSEVTEPGSALQAGERSEVREPGSALQASERSEVTEPGSALQAVGGEGRQVLTRHEGSEVSAREPEGAITIQSERGGNSSKALEASYIFCLIMVYIYFTMQSKNACDKVDTSIYL
jgi:hypothetical protein